MSDLVTCPDCDGDGWITIAAPNRDPQLEREDRCRTCHGDGTVDEQTIADRADSEAYRPPVDLPVSAEDFSRPVPIPGEPPF